MNFGKVRIAYPYIEYSLEVTHHTDRKSTAPEWVLLEIAKTVENFPEYSAVPLNEILKNLFFIADSDVLLRQILLDLTDSGALEYISDFTDRSDWNKLLCGDLKLTAVGRTLQEEGRLPAKTQTNLLAVTYDVVNNRLSENNKVLSDNTLNTKAREIDTENLPVFPEPLINDYVKNLQKKSDSKISWLQKNSRVDSIAPVGDKIKIKWKNTVKEISADENGNLSLKDETDSEIIERALKDADFGELPDYDLPVLSVNELSEKRNVQPYSKGIENIVDVADKSKIFFIAPQFEETFSNLKGKTFVVFGQPSFDVEQNDTKEIFRIPQNIDDGMCYQDSFCRISAGKVEIHFGNVTRQVAYIYETSGNFEQELIEIAEKYYLSEPRILRLLNFIKNPPYQKFYTEDFIKQKLSAPQMEIFTPVDENLEKLLNLDKKITEFLPDLNSQTNCDEIRRHLIKEGVNFLIDVHDLVSRRQKITDDVYKETSINLNETFLQNSQLATLIERIEKISEATSLFFDEVSEEYNKFYVIETSALLHYPALLDDFTKDNRTLIILPQDVLSDLEELTTSENVKTKTDAEKAIQKIEGFKNKRQLNLDEESHEELLEETEKDYQIFSVVFKYIVKNPVLVTDKNDFKDFAESKGVETITAHELHEKLNVNTSSKGKSKNKSKGKKNKR